MKNNRQNIDKQNNKNVHDRQSKLVGQGRK